MDKDDRMPHLYNLIGDVIPNDHSRQVTSVNVCDEILGRENIQNVLDLGCGAGNSLDYFKRKNPKIEWVGLDIEGSPEVKSRTRTDGKFIFYDGIHIPFKDNSFDMVFSNHVFHHVRKPWELLREVSRVLKPEGRFVGSVSYLEPYQSYSLWNYTPYGFKVLIEDAGMRLTEIRPSIDALTLIIRRALGKPKFFSRYWRRESPFNKLISLIGIIKKMEHNKINLMKILICGQFIIVAQKTQQHHNENVGYNNK